MPLRDIPIPNLRALGDGIWIGGQPTVEHLERAHSCGLESVITLCSPHECSWDERAVAATLGLGYESIPIASGGDLTTDAARRLHVSLDVLLRPVLVHCGSGNRVGALFALRACLIEGRPLEAAVDEGRRAGLTSLEATVRQILSV